MLGIGLRGEMGTMGSIQQDRKLLGDRKLLQDWICQSLGWDSAPQRVPRTWQGKSWGWRRRRRWWRWCLSPSTQLEPGQTWQAEREFSWSEKARKSALHQTELCFVDVNCSKSSAVQAGVWFTPRRGNIGCDWGGIYPTPSWIPVNSRNPEFPALCPAGFSSTFPTEAAPLCSKNCVFWG